MPETLSINIEKHHKEILGYELSLAARIETMRQPNMEIKSHVFSMFTALSGI